MCECGWKTGYANGCAAFANKTKQPRFCIPPIKNDSLASLVKPIEISHPDLSTKMGWKWLPKSGSALVSKVVCEFTSQRVFRLNVDGGWRDVDWPGALVNGMVCRCTTRRYANETRTNLEQKEHARAPRKAKQSEEGRENSKNTKEYNKM